MLASYLHARQQSPSVARMQASTSEATDTPAVRIRPEAVIQFRNAAGITSNRALAALAGVDQSTLQRVLAGTAEPSSRFISGLMRAFPDATFEDLFEH